MTAPPFLRLLRAYLLQAIDELPEASRSVLVSLEPKLQATYNFRGSWDIIVAREMDFPSEFPDKVRQIWLKNRELAERAHQTLDPPVFVDMFLRENFPFVFE